MTTGLRDCSCVLSYEGKKWPGIAGENKGAGARTTCDLRKGVGKECCTRILGAGEELTGTWLEGEPKMTTLSEFIV